MLCASLEAAKVLTSDLCSEVYLRTPHHSHIYDFHLTFTCVYRSNVPLSVRPIQQIVQSIHLTLLSLHCADELVDTLSLTSIYQNQAKLTKTVRGVVCCLQANLSQCWTRHNNDFLGRTYPERRSTQCPLSDPVMDHRCDYIFLLLRDNGEDETTSQA